MELTMEPADAAWLAHGNGEVTILPECHCRDSRRETKERVPSCLGNDVDKPLPPITRRPGTQDMVDAKLLYVKLKCNWSGNPEVPSLDVMKAMLGDGGMTEPWQKLDGLRHKYFLYDHETHTVSGVYVFFNQAALDAYIGSDLFMTHKLMPHFCSVVAEEHDVMSGTECSIENYPWENTPPTREDVTNASMLIVHLKIKADLNDETDFRRLMRANGGGRTKAFNRANGPKDLRGKYFTYNAQKQMCSGFYTFLNKQSMEAYLASDLFMAPAYAPTVSEFTYTIHEVLPGTERSMDLGEWTGKPVKPGPQDMADAKLLHVKLKCNWGGNPYMPNMDTMRLGLGDGGMTKPWQSMDGLRHKYFLYNEEEDVMSGVYVFYRKAALERYMSTDLFMGHKLMPHFSEVVAEVHDVLPGTECCVENYDWENRPPTREDVTKAWMLIVNLKLDPHKTNELSLRLSMMADAGGYTQAWDAFNGPEDLRGKYFAYNSSTHTCSGYYTFLNQKSMDAYIASDLFQGQLQASNVIEATFSVHEILPGTERSIDLGEWTGC